MIRSAAPFAVGLATLMVAAPALAADMGDPFGSDDGLRSGYSDQWDNSDQGSPLSFQAGVRYWYSWGAQSFTINPYYDALGVSDQTHSAEAFFRLDDHSTGWFLKGLAGGSFLTSGSLSGLQTGSAGGGNVDYAGGDIGFSWVNAGKGGPTFGPLLGYMYWNDSPDASNNDAANNFTTATSASDITWDHTTGQTFFPGNSTADHVETNMLRLGVSGTAQLSSYIDVSGEAVLVPYARINGVLGNAAIPTDYYVDPPGAGTTTVTTDPNTGYNVADIQSSPTALDGWGYGAMAEGFVGFHPTQNIAIKLGGRLWYLQGKADVTYSAAHIGNPGQTTVTDPPNFDQAPSFYNQNYIWRDQSWSLLRYGLLAEFSYQF